MKRRKVEEISLLHPASVSLPFHLPQIHGVGQSGKKTDAFFMGESMNGEAEAEAAESLGMELTASPMKSSMCSRWAKNVFLFFSSSSVSILHVDI